MAFQLRSGDRVSGAALARAAVVAVTILTTMMPAPAAGQAEPPSAEVPGPWWFHTGFGITDVRGEYGSILTGGTLFDLSFAKEVGNWRLGGGLLFEGLGMREPYEDELEWVRLELFAAVMRVFNRRGRVRPYVEARPGLVRSHARSVLFHQIPMEEFQRGRDPTPAANGFGFSIRPGVELAVTERFALDLSASYTTYTSGDYDLAPIQRSPVSSGFGWALRLGLTWRSPDLTGVTRRPASGSSGEPVPGLDAWNVPRSWTWANGQMLGLNFVASMLNEYTRDEASYPISPSSWRDNVELGWRFDDNKFLTNQLIHPWNGGAYFNSARSNGIGFWGSSAVTLAGAFLWECCGETRPMSWNDFLSTAIGGVSQGEVAYRTSSIILDNTATGRGRTVREITAFLVNPVRGFNRLVSGRWSAAGQNPSSTYDHRPPLLITQINTGVRIIGLGQSITDNTSRYGFTTFTLIYGDPFENTRRKPFDRFDAYLQLNFGDKAGIGRLQVRGDLWSKPLSTSSEGGPRHAIAIAHDFDYINNEAYEFGGQGLGVAFFSRFGSFDRRFITRFSLTGVVGAAVNADYAFLAAIPAPRELRDYDYGAGLGFGFEGLLTEQARITARLDYRYTLMSVFNGSLSRPASGLFDFGSDARHQVHRAGVEALVAITDDYSIGFQSNLFYRDSKYDAPELEDRTQRNPELRVYLSRLGR